MAEEMNMILKKYIWMILAALMLSSCDLLGIGGDDEERETGPSLVWKLEDTGGATGVPPIIDQGKVYIRGFELIKVDLQTGSREWGTGRPYAGDPLDNSRKMLATEQAVIESQPSTIRAYQKSDGQLIWEANTGFSFEETDIRDAAPFPAVQTSNHIFMAHKHDLIGLNKSTGNREVEITLDATGPDNEPEKLTALAAEQGAGTLLIAATQYAIDDGFIREGRVIALDPQDGRTVWSVEVSDTSGGRIPSAPLDLAVANDLLLVLTGFGVTALEPGTGNVVWQTALDNSGTQLLAADNAIFVSGFGGNIHRLNSSNGSVQWQTSASEVQISFNIEPLVWDDEYLYYPEFSGDTYGIRIIDAQNGNAERIFKPSDINIGEFAFGLFGGLAVKDSYMVRQGSFDTYGIKF